MNRPPYIWPFASDGRRIRKAAALFQRRDAVRAIAKEYQDLLRARWLANNASRKTKRKVERQAERRQVRRQLERQNEEPSEDYVCSGGFSDDEDYFRHPDNPPVPSDGPIACSDYELKRLQTMVAITRTRTLTLTVSPNPEPNPDSGPNPLTQVANARVIADIFASALQKKKEDGSAWQCDEDEAAKTADLLAQAIERLEAQQAMINAATQRRMQNLLRAQRESERAAAAQWDAWESAL